MKNINKVKKINNDKVNLPQKVQDQLLYYNEIRASWIANQSHCDENSPSKRQSYIDKNIKFSNDWIGEVGFLRYYLFHRDNNYEPGKSTLKRKDGEKGFNPENCIIVNNTNKPKPSKKPKRAKNVKDNKRTDSIKNEVQDIVILDKKETIFETLFSNFGIQSNNNETTKCIILYKTEGRNN